MKRKESGFTTVELLTVVAIIALLVGLLIPALSAVRNIAKETKQKAQFTAIELALTAFKNDYGDYPPSERFSHITGVDDYCGAQKLAEALLGWDLLGFHPDSAWRADGLDIDGGPLTYDPPTPGHASLDDRVGPYLDLATRNAFRLWQLFGADIPQLNADTFVICDVFDVPERRIMLANGKAVTPGTPILYYKANTASKQMIIDDYDEFENNIYNIRDNGILVGLGKIKDGTIHPLWEPDVFYSMDRGIIDPKVTARIWPYRPDSYILISAGADGLYGTGDDIRNFGN